MKKTMISYEKCHMALNWRWTECYIDTWSKVKSRKWNQSESKSVQSVIYSNKTEILVGCNFLHHLIKWVITLITDKLRKISNSM